MSHRQQRHGQVTSALSHGPGFPCASHTQTRVLLTRVFTPHQGAREGHSGIDAGLSMWTGTEHFGSKQTLSARCYMSYMDRNTVNS